MLSHSLLSSFYNLYLFVSISLNTTPPCSHPHHSSCCCWAFLRHALVHGYTHTHPHKQVCAHMHTHMHAHAHTHKHTHTHTHTCVLVHNEPAIMISTSAACCPSSIKNRFTSPTIDSAIIIITIMIILIYTEIYAAHKRFKKKLFIRTKQKHVNFQGNPIYQATKRHLNNS